MLVKIEIIYSHFAIVVVDKFFAHTAPPKIEIDEKFLNVTIRAGGKATISAIITGLPVPDVTWLKDDVPLETTKRVSISEDKQEKLIVKMILDKAERSDLGTYTLTAANDVGKDLVKMTITVLGINKYIFACNYYSFVVPVA